MKSNNKKNFVWNAIGLSFYAFISLFLLIIVKRINGMNDAGIFTYAYSLTTLFLYISLYYNRVYQIANYNDNKSFNQFFTVRLFTSLISLLVVIIFSIINGFDLYKSLVILILMLYRMCDAIADTFYGFIQGKNNLYRVGISYTLKSFIGVLLFLLIDIYTNNLLYSCGIIVIINVIFLLLYDLKNYKLLGNNSKIRFDFTNYKLIIREGFPIFAFSFFSIYLANSQKYILNYFVSNEMQTVFGILIMPATFLSLVGSYLIMPFLNKLNELFKKNKIKELQKLCGKILMALFGLGIIGTILCYFIGIPILNIIYGVNIWKYRLGLELIIIGSIFGAATMILSNILTVFNDNNIQIIIYVIGSIISTILSIFMIKNHSIKGANITYLIVCLMVFSLYYLRYNYDIKNNNSCLEGKEKNEKRKES